MQAKTPRLAAVLASACRWWRLGHSAGTFSFARSIPAAKTWIFCDGDVGLDKKLNLLSILGILSG